MLLVYKYKTSEGVSREKRSLLLVYVPIPQLIPKSLGSYGIFAYLCQRKQIKS